MDENVLLLVTVSRKKDEIVYSVDRSNDLTNEELEYYLKEIIPAYANGNRVFAKKQCTILRA